MPMLFSDAMVVDAQPRMTADGYMVASARVAKAGIQEYMPQELGKSGNKPIRLYRPADEVFAQDTLSTFAHRPVTNGHPTEDVTAQNWARYAKGYTGDEVARDGEMIRVPLTLMDATAIKDCQTGKRELSAGYSADIDWTAGVTDSGEHYDGIQRNIRNNHIALVDAARAGHDARIGDAGTPPNAGKDDGGHTMADTRQVVVDGLTIETTDQGAQAIEKVSKQLADSQAKLQEVTDAKDKELAAKDAEIDKLKSQVMDEAALDKAIMDRADLIGMARQIADVDYTGKSLTEIRKTAVKAKLGDAAVADKSDAYIEARFDVLKEGLKDASPELQFPDGKRSGDVFKDAQTARDAWVQRVYNGGAAAQEA